MCTPNQTLTLPDGSIVETGWIDCMSKSCNNSSAYNPPPQPDED